MEPAQEGMASVLEWTTKIKMGQREDLKWGVKTVPFVGNNIFNDKLNRKGYF